jgi:hypothetical protein
MDLHHPRLTLLTVIFFNRAKRLGALAIGFTQIVQDPSAAIAVDDEQIVFINKKTGGGGIRLNQMPIGMGSKTYKNQQYR